jgi:hypothetical protein
MQKIDQEVDNYYQTYFDLFNHTGWEQFQADVQAAADTIQILALQDAKELHIAQGQLQVFNRLLGWQDAISNSYDQILQEAESNES